MRKVFESKQAVIDYLRELPELTWLESRQCALPAGIYYLSHGEYAKPTYCPRKYKDGWGVHVKYHYYYGTFHAPKDGRCEL